MKKLDQACTMSGYHYYSTEDMAIFRESKNSPEENTVKLLAAFGTQIAKNGVPLTTNAAVLALGKAFENAMKAKPEEQPIEEWVKENRDDFDVLLIIQKDINRNSPHCGEFLAAVEVTVLKEKVLINLDGPLAFEYPKLYKDMWDNIHILYGKKTHEILGEETLSELKKGITRILPWFFEAISPATELRGELQGTIRLYERSEHLISYKPI